MRLRTLVVTGADESFAGLLRGLLGSLDQWARRPFEDIACFDFGLSRKSRDWLAPRVRHLVIPGWDLNVSPKTGRTAPHLRSLTVRPFLRRYFPGYDIYLWIDADCWVQQRFALDAFVEGATRSGLALTPHDHPAYLHTATLTAYRTNERRLYFGKDATDLPSLARYFNAGVAALRADAPHWDRWAFWFRAGLRATRGALVSDQLALNQAVQADALPVDVLSALCNWCCHLALPRFDSRLGLLCEPTPPGKPLGIVHLSGRDKNPRIQVKQGDTSAMMSLTFPGPGSKSRTAPEHQDEDPSTDEQATFSASPRQRVSGRHTHGR